MSTETTNKKIKIDNGTTFGRTYTDKAVDELLKNAGGGGISVIELTDKNGTIASAQLGKINANPQNFAFKYNGKILLFARAGSTTYQYCNNTTNSSDNNVMTTSTLLTIESGTGVYTIAENVHNVVANSIHPVNGGDLTNIQVGSKVYSIPSGGNDLYFDLSPFMETMQLDAEAFEKFQIDISEGKLLGVTLIGTGLCFNYKGIMQNNPEYWFYFSNSTESVLINSTGAISTGNSIDIPFLPTDASSKNYALNSVNGTLTWNTIGDGLTIENGALKATGGGGGIKNIVIDEEAMTWDVSQVDTTKDKIILLNNFMDGNAIAVYEKINIETGEFGYRTTVKEIYPYVSNFINSVAFTTIILKLDGTADMIYEAYYISDNKDTITFLNENMISGEVNYNVESMIVPTLPADASSKTYTLKAVNGVLTWVE